MLSLPPSVRIWLCLAPADMRRGFDGLAAMARDFLGQDPLSGHLFVFRNRRGDRLKVLWWDRDGFALWYKRLERGVFQFPSAEGTGLVVNAADLSLVLEGIDPRSVKRRRRLIRIPA